MTAALSAGAAYFAMVFALGFSLGTVRVLLLERRLGATAAVLCELPLMLGFSWFAADWAAAWFGAPTGFAARLLMGAVAFLLLMAAEAGLSLAFGRSLGEHVKRWRTPPGALGLAGQVAFALVPPAQTNPAGTALLLVLTLAAGWIGWRMRSRRALLPCPAELAFLVEMENPLARATRSEAVVRLLAPRPGERILDVGCGPGRVALPLARAVAPGGEVVALDLQAGMLDRAKERAAREGVANIRLLQADTRSAGVTPGSLDGATLVMALGEIPDPAGALATIHAALKPGGRLLVAESVFDPHFIRRRTLRTLGQEAGFAEEMLEGNVFGYACLLRRAVEPSPAGC